MKILVVGSGGREHALVWKLGQSPQVEKIYCTGDNARMSPIAENVDIKVTDIEALKNFALCHGIDLTIIGPELPLVNGIVNAFQAAGLPIFGPSSAAAQIEGSKAYAKKMMDACGVSTAPSITTTDYDLALKYLANHSLPVVIKADGLAAGKGVYVCSSAEEAKQALHDLFHEQKFGSAGTTVVIEEYLEGEEISVLALCDGKSFQLLLPSQDHKRLGDGDTGPNTGGMGAIAPVPWVTMELLERIKREIFEPILQGFIKTGAPFTGCLYAGLMITKDGPKVLEFNVRFGDPETEAILPLMKSDPVPYLLACTDGTLDTLPPIKWHDGYAVCVVLASKGYPDKYETGIPIGGIFEMDKNDSSLCLFHAGTKLEGKGCYLTSGGRVLAVTKVAPTLREAINGAYQECAGIMFAGKQYRTDIGAKALKKMAKL